MSEVCYWGDVGSTVVARRIPTEPPGWSDLESLERRRAFSRTYLERDIPQLLGPRVPAETLRRFWTMLAHEQDGMIHEAKLAGALAVSGQTLGRYLDQLRRHREDAFKTK